MRVNIRQTQKKSLGFTLLEILIALFIFAILGTLAAIGLQTVLQVHKRVSKVDQRLQKLEVAMTLMRRDVSQIIDRPVIDENGDLQPPVIGIGNSQFIFTRTGFSNPLLYEKRSDLERVGYALIKNNLVRLTWSAVDRPPNSKPMRQILLTQVQDIQIQFLDAKGQLTEMWISGVGNSNQSDLPCAIIVTLKLRHWGVLQNVIPIPARGVHEKQ